MDDLALPDTPPPEQLTPKQAEEQKEFARKLRQRARKYLSHYRPKLPKLTRTQAALATRMLMTAYSYGWNDGIKAEAQAWSDDEHEKRRKAATQGVIARRRKSKQPAIRADFQAGRKAGKDVCVKQLAKKHGVSVNTAYRALNGLLKPAKS